MIIGGCPYDDCSEVVANLIADQLGFTKQNCPACGREYWLKHSRLDPAAWTTDSFLQEFIVDEENGTIIPKGPQWLTSYK